MRVPASLVVFPAALALYSATLARLHPPDAVAYSTQVTRHLPVEPEHMLHPWLGRAAVALGELAGLEAMTSLSLLNALAGALACALVAAIVQRAGGRGWLAGALGLGVAGTWALWHQATTWEAHALPTAALLGVAWLVATRRPAWALGLGLGLAGLLHLVAGLAVPGAALAAWLQRRRLGDAALVVGLSGSLVAVGLLLVLGPELLGAPPLGPAPGEPGAGDTLDRLHLGLQRWLAWVGGPRCGGGPRVGLLGPAMVDGLLLAGTAALAAVLLAARRSLHAARPLLTHLLAWAAVALPATAWFEPDNSEYLLAPGLGLVVLGGVAASHLVNRRATELALASVALAIGLVVGVHDWQADVGPARRADAHGPCRGQPEPPSSTPPPPPAEPTLRQRLLHR